MSLPAQTISLLGGHMRSRACRTLWVKPSSRSRGPAESCRGESPPDAPPPSHLPCPLVSSIACDSPSQIIGRGALLSYYTPPSPFPPSPHHSPPRLRGHVTRALPQLLLLRIFMAPESEHLTRLSFSNPLLSFAGSSVPKINNEAEREGVLGGCAPLWVVCFL